jgi:hypothetical protein
MTQPSEGDSARFSDEVDQDTIELELTPEHLLWLSESARQGPPQAKPATEPVPTGPDAERQLRQKTPSSDVVARIRRWPLATAAGVVGFLAGALTMWGGAHREPNHAPPPPPPPVPIVATTAASAPPAPVENEPPAEPNQAPPLRVKNPFDASEVFEFPPGTSKADARQLVADILLERARDRRPAVKIAKPTGANRTAPTGSRQDTGLAQN